MTGAPPPALPALALPSESAWAGLMRPSEPRTMLQALPGELRRLRALGAELVEFPGEVLAIDDAYLSPDLWREVARLLRDEGLGATLHLPMAWVDLAALDRGVWEGGLASLERTLLAVEPLEPKLAAVHPANYATEIVLRRAPAAARRGLTEALAARLVAALARLGRGPCGKAVALENVAGVPLDLLAAAGAAAGVGLCLDVGHALVEGQDPVYWFDTLADRLTGLHLHDAVAASEAGPGTEPAHRPLGAGRLDLDALLRALLARRYTGPVVLEILGDPAASARLFAERLSRLAAS